MTEAVTQDATTMHCEPVRADAEASPTRACGYCLTPFLPRRSWARFCSTVCRNEFHAKVASDGTAAKVSKVSVLKGGGLSIVVRLTPAQRETFATLAPGQTLQVRRP